MSVLAVRKGTLDSAEGLGLCVLARRPGLEDHVEARVDASHIIGQVAPIDQRGPHVAECDLVWGLEPCGIISFLVSPE